MAAVEGSYAAEVSSARQRIKLLKDRLARRAAARQAFAAGKPFGAQPGQTSAEGDAAADATAEAVAVLKRLIASHLLQLDVSQLPTDSQTVQKKVISGCCVLCSLNHPSADFNSVISPHAHLSHGCVTFSKS